MCLNLCIYFKYEQALARERDQKNIGEAGGRARMQQLEAQVPHQPLFLVCLILDSSTSMIIY
jgi:hypothetical protein